MAFGKKRRRIEELSAQLSQAQQLLGEFETVRPFLEDAKAIHVEVSAILEEGGGNYSTAEIATRAIELVSRRKHDAVYNRLADECTVELEEEILAKLIEDARQKERETGEIASKVRAEYAINPDTQAKLVQLAQRTIWQEEQGRLVDEIKEQQRAQVEQELAQQEVYNRYNLDFAHNAHINLADSELQEWYATQDLLVLSIKGRRKPLIYKYHSSSNEGAWWQHHKGEVYGANANKRLVQDKERVFRLGTAMPNVDGQATIIPNHLTTQRLTYAIYKSSPTKGDDVYTPLNRDFRAHHPVILTNVQLFTPIAYAMHKKQQQN